MYANHTLFEFIGVYITKSIRSVITDKDTEKMSILRYKAMYTLAQWNCEHDIFFGYGSAINRVKVVSVRYLHDPYAKVKWHYFGTLLEFTLTYLQKKYLIYCYTPKQQNGPKTMFRFNQNNHIDSNQVYRIHVQRDLG